MKFKLPDIINGPQAWYGPDMSQSKEWLHSVSKNEVAEIDAAIKMVEGKNIVSLTRTDFLLPELGKKLKIICDEVMNGRGFALLRGLPVDRWSLEEAATAYFGIGTYLGSARSQNGDGHVLGHVRDLGRDAVNDTNARIYQTRERQLFHTDSCDLVALLCLKTAKSGGASALVSSMTIYNEMYRRRPDLLRLLFEPFATDRRGEIPAGKKPFFKIPVFNFYENHLSVIYARRYINSAQRFDEVPSIEGDRLEALDLFDSLANDPKLNLTMSFEPGDVQFVHNHTMLHDRTDYVDWEREQDKRHLLRLWLAIPDARPLPEVFKERYGSIEIGNRGGIIVPGSRLKAPLIPV